MILQSCWAEELSTSSFSREARDLYNCREGDHKMISRLVILLRRAKDILQTEGLATLLRRSLKFVQAWFFKCGEYYLYELALGGTSQVDFMPSVNGLTCEIISTNNEADALAAAVGFDFRRRFINARKSLDKGAIAFCVLFKGQMASIGWVALSEEAKKSLYSLPQKVDFSKGEAYIGGLETIPEYRRKDLASYGSVRRLQFLNERGITNTRYAVSASNIGAQTLAAKFGLEKYAEARYLKLLWWKSWTEIPLAQSRHGD